MHGIHVSGLYIVLYEFEHQILWMCRFMVIRIGTSYIRINEPSVDVYLSGHI